MIGILPLKIQRLFFGVGSDVTKTAIASEIAGFTSAVAKELQKAV